MLLLIVNSTIIIPFPPTNHHNRAEGRIDGNFEGWEGETIFKLQNGQIWQQTDYSYTYRYKYSPKVIIFRSGSGYRMKVDGVDKEVAVKRIK